MFARYIIPAILLAFWLAPAQARAGDLEGLTNTLENLADMSRSADDAHEAMRNAVRGAPSRYYRDYDRDYDDDDYYRDRYYRHKAWKAEREQEKYMRKQAKKWRKHREKEWRKYHDHDWRRYHGSYHGPRRHPGPPPPFPPHFW